MAGGREPHGPEPTSHLLHLLHYHHHHHAGGVRRSSIPLLLGRAASRRLIRPPSTSPVTAEEEERQLEWGYSKPVVALDVAWNLAFVLVAATVLLSTAKEKPSTPIRAWVFGYAFQCLLHVGFVCFEYRRRRRRMARRGGLWVGAGEEEVGVEESGEIRAVKKLESLNALISLAWWMFGFYWIVEGGPALLQDAPRLYWLTVVFLAFDVFFAIFCIAVACVIAMALCCCLPCIIAFLYSVVRQEGASDADLSTLPKFRFCQASRSEKFNFEEEQAVALTIEEANPVDDLALPSEDSACCICLTQYEDGAELHLLPCNHHFHSGCIIKWLRLNATCPLCKHNICADDNHV